MMAELVPEPRAGMEARSTGATSARVPGASMVTRMQAAERQRQLFLQARLRTAR